MASSLKPIIKTFLCDAAIAKGVAVKKGAGGVEYVQVCTAASDKSIGVTQNATTAAGDYVEVAMHGGGGKGLAQGTISMGDRLTSHTDGSLKAASSGELIVATAMDDAVVSDMFDLVVGLGIY